MWQQAYNTPALAEKPQGKAGPGSNELKTAQSYLGMMWSYGQMGSLRSTKISIPPPCKHPCLSWHNGGKTGDKLIPYLNNLMYYPLREFWQDKPKEAMSESKDRLLNGVILGPMADWWERYGTGGQLRAYCAIAASSHSPWGPWTHETRGTLFCSTQGMRNNVHEIGWFRAIPFLQASGG